MVCLVNEYISVLKFVYFSIHFTGKYLNLSWYNILLEYVFKNILLFGFELKNRLLKFSVSVSLKNVHRKNKKS